MSGMRPNRGGGNGRPSEGSTLAMRGRGASHTIPFNPRGGGHGGGPRASSHPTLPDYYSRAPPAKINAEVQKLEKVITEDIKQTSSTLQPGTHNRMPLRPGYGTRGDKILLWANYFELVAPRELVLYRYKIEIHPDATGKSPIGRKLKRIVEILIEENFAAQRSHIATDFKSTFMSRSELDLQRAGYRVQYRTEKEDTASHQATVYRIQLRAEGSLRMADLINYICQTDALALLASKEDMVQALSIVLGHYPKNNADISSIGANKHFDISEAGMESTDLGAGLTAIRGFFISVRAATSRMLVNVQVKHAATYNKGPLEQLILVFCAANGKDLRKLERFLKKLRVSAIHITRKNQHGEVIPNIKTIHGLANPSDGNGLWYPPKVSAAGAGPENVHFYLERGLGSLQAGYVSVAEFFRRIHNFTIPNTSLPVVNVGTRDFPVYLPAAACVVLPGQTSKAKLSPRQTQNMILFSVRKPAHNIHSIVSKGAEVLGIDGSSSNPILDAFGIKISPDLLTVAGRLLTTPDVFYENKRKVSPRNGSWNLNNVRFHKPAQLAAWTYLLFSTPGKADAWGSHQDMKATISIFQAKLEALGLGVSPFIEGSRYILKPDNIEMDIETAIKDCITNRPDGKIKLLLVLLPEDSAEILKCVKTICDTRIGLINICAVGSRFANANDQYFSNVALKFNLQLGGCNHVLDPSKLGLIAEGKTMVVGLDVTHPSPGSVPDAPSVAGMVASVGRWLSQWPAQLSIQTGRQEMIAALDTMLKSHLKLWSENHNGSYPENILVYRDGVSEGQYHVVLERELPLLRKACTEVYPANHARDGFPKISIIIVGKRHHTRFYPTKAKEEDRSKNTRNGTITDRGVTEARSWNFYLQAHTALQGTARPTHYFVIFDEIFRGIKPKPPFENAADILEDLTHNMCYLYGRATKAVSICPPAYYADKLCERARLYLSEYFDASQAGSAIEGATRPIDPAAVQIHPNVKNVMFYI